MNFALSKNIFLSTVFEDGNDGEDLVPFLLFLSSDPISLGLSRLVWHKFLSWDNWAKIELNSRMPRRWAFEKTIYWKFAWRWTRSHGAHHTFYSAAAATAATRYKIRFPALAQKTSKIYYAQKAPLELYVLVFDYFCELMNCVHQDRSTNFSVYFHLEFSFGLAWI